MTLKNADLAPIGLGIAGLGMAGAVMVQAAAAHPGFVLRAAADPHPAPRQAFARDFNASAYDDIAGLCADPAVEVVYIATPHQFHAPHAILAAEHGKHIILEKPISLSATDARAVAAAVKAAGVRTCVCFECRFSSQFLATKAVIDAGLLGALHYGEVDYYHGIGPWYGQYRWNTSVESGGSSLLSAGCHALDALLLCMGGQVESVTSSAKIGRAHV